MSRWALKIVFIFAGIPLCLAHPQNPPADGVGLTTAERLKEPGWWPTKGEPSRSEYSGSATCARCHQKIALLQKSTPMYHAGMPALQSDLLVNHLPLRFQEGTFSTSVTASPEQMIFSVTDGVNTTSVPAIWAFGSKNGQTYILEKDGDYFEGRLSFFTKTHSLDITPGQSSDLPSGLETALGRKLGIDTAQGCFRCHTTAATTSNKFESEKATAGVTCEACHGPGAAHVASMTADDPERVTAIMNPADLSPSNSVDFCGACHTAWADVVEGAGKPSAGLIRFQPYRLEQSRCWGTSGDPRLTCVACHDPHEPLVQEPTAYDSKCLACHGLRLKATRRHEAKTVCKVAVSNCVTCHMPKYELPQTHTLFTDHEIRVVRAKVLDMSGMIR